jgi:hypothetical protein
MEIPRHPVAHQCLIRWLCSNTNAAKPACGVAWCSSLVFALSGRDIGITPYSVHTKGLGHECQMTK